MQPRRAAHGRRARRRSDGRRGEGQARWDARGAGRECTRTLAGRGERGDDATRRSAAHPAGGPRAAPPPAVAPAAGTGHLRSRSAIQPRRQIIRRTAAQDAAHPRHPLSTHRPLHASARAFPSAPPAPSPPLHPRHPLAGDRITRTAFARQVFFAIPGNIEVLARARRLLDSNHAKLDSNHAKRPKRAVGFEHDFNQRDFTCPIGLA